MSNHTTVRLHKLLFFAFLTVCYAEAAPLSRILVLSETNGWDHQTRTVADSVISALGSVNGLIVTAIDRTDGYFTSEYLANCAAVCFVNTTGTIFTDEEAAAFRQYITDGGGYVGVHASTDCEYDRSWYAEMTGANFNGHPFNIAEANIAVLDKNHPSTGFITADTLIRTDEWYFWADNPAFQNMPLVDPAENDSITVLMELVESSIIGSTLSHFHPICWYKSFGKGRVWYCGFGHDPETFRDSLFTRMLLGGIRYAAGIAPNGIQTKLFNVEKRDIIPVRCRSVDCMGRVFGTQTGKGPASFLFSTMSGIRVPMAPGLYISIGHAAGEKRVGKNVILMQ